VDKAVGREVDHLPPPSSEVNNEWFYTSTHLHAFKERAGTNLCFSSKGDGDDVDDNDNEGGGDM
jgi:hypothetical protein